MALHCTALQCTELHCQKSGSSSSLLNGLCNLLGHEIIALFSQSVRVTIITPPEVQDVATPRRAGPPQLRLIPEAVLPLAVLPMSVFSYSKIKWLVVIIRLNVDDKHIYLNEKNSHSIRPLTSPIFPEFTIDSKCC